MIHLIKYKPEYTINNSYNININIKNNIMNVTVTDNSFGLQESLTLQTKILPYNRYIICLDKSRRKIQIINTTEYEEFKNYRLWYFRYATGNIILYTIAVCNMDYVMEPGTIIIQNINVISEEQQVKEYFINNTEEQDYYFWKNLNNIRDIYKLSVNGVTYYPSIVENNGDTPSIKEITSVIDLTKYNDSKFKFIVTRYQNKNKEISKYNGSIQIKTTSGELNTNYINFKNGIGNFIFYTLGYKGECIISIGEIFDGSFYKIKL